MSHQVSLILKNFYNKSVNRHLDGVCLWEDFDKTRPEYSPEKSRRNIVHDELSAEAIDSVKEKTDVEIVQFILKWLRKNYKSPLLNEDRWVNRYLRILYQYKGKLTERICACVADLFREIPTDKLMDNFRGPLDITKQGGKDDEWEKIWRKKWKWSSIPEAFLNHLESKTKSPMIFKGDDDARANVLTALGISLLSKNPDVLISANGWLVVGERKDMADQGDHQRKQADEAMQILSTTDLNNGVIGLAIMLGSYWDCYDHKSTSKHGCHGTLGVIHTALLTQFIEELPPYDGNKWKSL